MTKSLSYWRNKFENSTLQHETYVWLQVYADPVAEAWKTLDLLAEYAAFYKKKPFSSHSKPWAGSLGRFFAGRWNTNHGARVQAAITDYFDDKSVYSVDRKFQSVKFILALVKRNIGCHGLNPNGDLAKIFEVIKEKTQVDYFHLDVIKTLVELRRLEMPSISP